VCNFTHHETKIQARIYYLPNWILSYWDWCSFQDPIMDVRFGGIDLRLRDLWSGGCSVDRKAGIL